MTEHPNLAAALIAALADVAVVDKGRTANVGTYSYDYADIADVVKLTRPALAEHGVIALTPIHDHGSGLACTVTFLHTSGDRLDFGPFPFPHGRDAQATGSMVTYHRRYALVAALGIAAGDDDDGASAAPRQEPARQVVNPKAAPLAARLAVLPADAQSKILGWFNAPVEAWPSLSDTALDKLADVIGKAEAKVNDGSGSTLGDPDPLAKLHARIDLLPYVLRRACEDALTAGFDGRFPNELRPEDFPEAFEMVADFEKQVTPEPTAEALAARAGRRGIHEEERVAT